MNIFILDRNSVKSASYLCDKHLVKMILEHTQILCTVRWLNGLTAPYKPTHKNHPCVVWANSSLSNYEWLLKYTLAMCLEYNYRFGKTHKCQEIVEYCKANNPGIVDKGLTTFVQCMPNEYKNKNAIIAYRNYYLGEKMKFAKWNHSKTPNWVIAKQKKKLNRGEGSDTT